MRFRTYVPYFVPYFGACSYLGRRQNFTGQHFWARGYYVSTVGREEATIRQYIQKQAAEDQRLDQLNIFAR